MRGYKFRKEMGKQLQNTMKVLDGKRKNSPQSNFMGNELKI